MDSDSFIVCPSFIEDFKKLDKLTADIIIVKGWLGQLEIPAKWEQATSGFVTSSFIIKQEVFKKYYNPPFNLETLSLLDYAWWDKYIFYTEHKI